MKKKQINFLEFLFIRVLVLRFFTFIFNRSVLSFLFKSILFSSLILFLILTCKLIIQHVTNYKKDFLENLEKEVKSIFPLMIANTALFFL